MVTQTTDTVRYHGEGAGEATVAEDEKEAEMRRFLGNQPVSADPGCKT